MDDYKADRRGEDLWKQRARREEVRKKKVNGAPSAEEERESFFALISPHLSSLNRVVRHLIGFAEARGDLIPDEVTAEDIVDATMLRAYDEFVKDPVRGNIRSWLMGLAMEQLES